MIDRSNNTLCPFMSTRDKECSCKTNCKFYYADSSEPCAIENALSTLDNIDQRIENLEVSNL